MFAHSAECSQPPRMIPVERVAQTLNGPKLPTLAAKTIEHTRRRALAKRLAFTFENRSKAGNEEFIRTFLRLAHRSVALARSACGRDAADERTDLDRCAETD